MLKLYKKSFAAISLRSTLLLNGWPRHARMRDRLSSETTSILAGKKAREGKVIVFACEQTVGHVQTPVSFN
jgi:hypothetical protein